MNKIEVKDKELMPRRATFGSAGYDFFAPHDFIIPAHGVSETIDLGISVMLNPGVVLMCYVRSSWGFKHNITLVNGTGIIDSDFYPNSIKVKFKNDGDVDFVVHKDDKCMQGVVMTYGTFDNENEPSEKRNGGIGSTGK